MSCIWEKSKNILSIILYTPEISYSRELASVHVSFMNVKYNGVFVYRVGPQAIKD